MTELTPQLLLKAYSVGVFPMAESRKARHVYWIDPEWRGIIPLEAAHIPYKLRRILRRGTFEITCNHAYEKVLDLCAEPTETRPDTWINDDIRRLYSALHEMGYAHSVECWQDGALVGGLYGVSLGAAFFGESMFSRKANASKVALVHLIARLVKGGYRLLDSQFVTDHLRQFGAEEIPRGDYQARLREALEARAVFYPDLSGDELETFLQSSTQTS